MIKRIEGKEVRSMNNGATRGERQQEGGRHTTREGERSKLVLDGGKRVRAGQCQGKARLRPTKEALTCNRRSEKKTREVEDDGKGGGTRNEQGRQHCTLHAPRGERI